MSVIVLSNGAIAVVDEADYHRLNGCPWYETGDGYAARSESGGNGRRNTIYMHRDVLHFPRGFDVDHINGDKLDNRKANLRAVTKQQNQFNRGPIKGSLSQYKGVSWFPKMLLWRATIRVDKKSRHIGLFATEVEAAGAYNAMAIKHHGAFVRLNDVPTLNDWAERRAFRVQGKSLYRGVSLHAVGKWKASISYQGKRLHIGIYSNELEAATAYNRKAVELLGDKATLNRIEEVVCVG